jgi:hypothetical protein
MVGRDGASLKHGILFIEKAEAEWKVEEVTIPKKSGHINKNRIVNVHLKKKHSLPARNAHFLFSQLRIKKNAA